MVSVGEGNWSSPHNVELSSLFSLPAQVTSARERARFQPFQSCSLQRRSKCAISWQRAKGTKTSFALNVPKLGREKDWGTRSCSQQGFSARFTLRQKNLEIVGFFFFRGCCYNVLKPLRDKENSLEWSAYDCSDGEVQRCARRCKGVNNVVQEIMSSCEGCQARGPLEWDGYGLGQQWCGGERLGGHSAHRTHRGAMRCGANVEGMKDKFNLVCLLMARSLTSPSCCAVTHVLAVAQLSVCTEEKCIFQAWTITSRVV